MGRRSWAFDIADAAVVVAFGQLEAWWGINATHRQGPHWAEALAYGGTGLVLVFRRVDPLGALVAMLLIFTVESAIVGSPEGMGVLLPPVIAVYTAARWEDRRPRAWAALGVVLLTGISWTTFDPVSRTFSEHVAAMVWFSPFVISWLAGALVRSRLETAEQRRSEREQRASRAVAEERNRIARELHDVIGHSVSVMTVQASAVRRRLAPDQAAERQALETVESVGREALTEMRRMVGVLRQAGDRSDLEPPPGLAQLDRLVEKFRAAGLPVHLTVSGDERPLAPGLDLTAYRLVQEGLTNTLQHAVAPTRTEVSIGYGDTELELAVRDDGRPGTIATEAGHGLLGMRERVSVYGGRLVARPRPEGGFELVATLPLDGDA
jgi:signal transduction histidine kinase